jgi:hypothetical protein
MKKFRQLLKKANSSKAYNDNRKQILLGKDDFGKKLYPWDFVEVCCRMEMKSSWISQIYWTPLDGAFIDAHPGHIAMNCGEWTSRSLAPFLRDKSDITHIFHPEPETPVISHTIRKVNYKKYLEWRQERDKNSNDESVKQANIERREEIKKQLENE